VLSTSSAEPGAGEVASGAVEAPVEAKSSRNAAGSGDEKGLSRGNLSANSPARAMVQPVPLIPEELREAAFNSAALVRFHIAVDGGVEVELVKPTQNPRLNRILLDTLKRWRFSPALRNGQPVASTEEILVRIEVK
jgi:protein TonB